MASKAIFRSLPIDKIVLDTGNPRIARVIEMYGPNPSADEVHLALVTGGGQKGESGETSTNYYSLRESIKTNNGIIHPIIVNLIAKKKYVVIEGNTRVLIYKEFRDQNIKGNWNTISAMVYDDLDQNEIDAIRLQSHLVGPRPWDAYSKGKYLHYLSTTQNLTLNQIVDFCGGRKQEVITYITKVLHFFTPIIRQGKYREYFV